MISSRKGNRSIEPDRIHPHVPRAVGGAEDQADLPQRLGRGTVSAHTQSVIRDLPPLDAAVSGYQFNRVIPDERRHHLREIVIFQFRVEDELDLLHLSRPVPAQAHGLHAAPGGNPQIRQTVRPRIPVDQIAGGIQVLLRANGAKTDLLLEGVQPDGTGFGIA